MTCDPGCLSLAELKEQILFLRRRAGQGWWEARSNR